MVLGGGVPQQPPAKVGRRHAHIVACAARRHEHGAGRRARGAAPPVVAKKAVSLTLWRLWRPLGSANLCCAGCLRCEALACDVI